MTENPQESQAAPVLGIATTGEIVTIFVGPEKKRYNLHKDIICHHSEYFRVAYNGRWKEADEGVTLEDVEVPVFNVFVHWLYTQQVPEKTLDLGKIANVDGKRANYSHDDILLKACAFGNRFLATDFERVSHNHFVDHSARFACGVAYKDIIFAYENLPDDSLLLKMLVEVQSRLWDASGDDEKEEQMRISLPKEFLIQVMIRQAELRVWSEKDEWKMKPGDFYMQEKTGEIGE
ncbi:hypothetical protein J4E83_006456 [Alternaria metachromatica]|uniref:uncharacterized protein n=1 Tax=Alternaria metachromatica TaxID=283354 RepID=UPI0020C34200|nr:uncharacterized protein J4E83_006456 [Alternaria metachromatica]KAI4616874.1 hypothetical protein J4E83_006456 [Alternaria metachromatica]